MAFSSDSYAARVSRVLGRYMPSDPSVSTSSCVPLPRACVTAPLLVFQGLSHN
jgi:hypothetical protein